MGSVSGRGSLDLALQQLRGGRSVGVVLVGGAHAHLQYHPMFGEARYILCSYPFPCGHDLAGGLFPARPCPPGAGPHGNIKDVSLVDDLRRRQNRRLAEGGDPHSKLPRLLELQPTTGKQWYRPDMTAEHHAATVRDWEKRAPLSFCQQTAACGHAGSRTTFATLSARARQQWLLVEPCMREPLMLTPLDYDTHPHFKRPPPQGWSLGC